MKIVLYGASGMIGSRILTEAVSRGHDVIAVARNSDAIAAHAHVTALKGDATDAASIAATGAGADVAVSAYSPGHDNADSPLLSKHMHALLTGLAQAGVPRLIAVGGASSLEVAPGVELIAVGG